MGNNETKAPASQTPWFKSCWGIAAEHRCVAGWCDAAPGLRSRCKAMLPAPQAEGIWEVGVRSCCRTQVTSSPPALQCIYERCLEKQNSSLITDGSYMGWELMIAPFITQPASHGACQALL